MTSIVWVDHLFTSWFLITLLHSNPRSTLQTAEQLHSAAPLSVAEAAGATTRCDQDIPGFLKRGIPKSPWVSIPICLILGDLPFPTILGNLHIGLNGRATKGLQFLSIRGLQFLVISSPQNQILKRNRGLVPDPFCNYRRHYLVACGDTRYQTSCDPSGCSNCWMLRNLHSETILIVEKPSQIMATSDENDLGTCPNW